MIKLCIRGFFLSALLLWSCILSAPPTDNYRVGISSFFVKVNGTSYYGSRDGSVVTIYIADTETAQLDEVEIIYRDEMRYTLDFSDGEPRSISILEEHGREKRYTIKIIPSPSFGRGFRLEEDGTLSEEDGFRLIFHAGQLTDTASEIRGGLNGKYRLMNPIVLTEAFVPIAPDTDSSMAGHQGTKFTGIFDGNDKSINNLKILVAQDYVGFFTAIGDKGEVHSLTLVLAGGDAETPSIEGASYVGALAGKSEDTARIHDVRAFGGFIKGVSNVGGLVGYNIGGTITESYAEGEVTTESGNAGGLVGNNEGTVEDSSAAGTVRSESGNVGGLVGFATTDSSFRSLITGSHATGDVTGEGTSTNMEGVGGLVGWNKGGKIEDSFATGEVTGNNKVGGLVGYAADHTFETTPGISTTRTTHYGVITGSHATGTVIGTGTGTEANVGGLVGSNESRVNSDDAKSINNSYATGNVSGTKNVGGLVGSNVGTITHSHAEGTVIGTGTGTEANVGGLVGSNASSAPLSIGNSYATGDVTSEGDNVGGLLGNNNAGIERNYATGNVSGKGNVGGLLGYAGSSSSIEHSYAEGTVTGTGDYVGGLVGYNLSHSSLKIENSYATGEVSGANYIGGLIGNNKGIVTKSYATGAVEGTGSNIGGLVGYNVSGTVTHSYFDATTTGQSLGAPNLSSTNQVTPYYTIGNKVRIGDDVNDDAISEENFKDSTNSNNDWNFTDIWHWQGIGQWPILKFETE